MTFSEMLGAVERNLALGSGEHTILITVTCLANVSQISWNRLYEER